MSETNEGINPEIIKFDEELLRFIAEYYVYAGYTSCDDADASEAARRPGVGHALPPFYTLPDKLLPFVSNNTNKVPSNFRLEVDRMISELRESREELQRHVEAHQTGLRGAFECLNNPDISVQLDFLSGKTEKERKEISYLLSQLKRK